MGNKAEGCVLVGSLEPFSELGVEEMVGREMEAVGAHRYRLGTRKTGMEGP